MNDNTTNFEEFMKRSQTEYTADVDTFFASIAKDLPDNVLKQVSDTEWYLINPVEDTTNEVDNTTKIILSHPSEDVWQIELHNYKGSILELVRSINDE